jgi:hypothetical protein
VPGENTETIDKKLNHLCELCGKVIISPFFWTLPRKACINLTMLEYVNLLWSTDMKEIVVAIGGTDKSTL